MVDPTGIEPVSLPCHSSIFPLEHEPEGYRRVESHHFTRIRKPGSHLCAKASVRMEVGIVEMTSRIGDGNRTRILRSRDGRTEPLYDTDMKSSRANSDPRSVRDGSRTRVARWRDGSTWPLYDTDRQREATDEDRDDASESGGNRTHVKAE